MSCHSRRGVTGKQADYTLVLAGNPNVGKSVLFSKITGLCVDVANYPGKTVELNVGVTRIGSTKLRVIDLPGSYSFSPFSEDQAVASRALFEEQPDLIVAVVDSTNLERNLFLVMQLLETGQPLVIALNMIDCAEKKGIHIDHEKLSKILGVSIIPTVATKNTGIEELLEAIAEKLTENHPSSPIVADQCYPMTSLARTDHYSDGSEEIELAQQKYGRIQEITRVVTSNVEVPEVWAEKLKHYSVRPATGIPLLGVVVLAMFGFMSTAGGVLSDILTSSWSVLISPTLTSLVYWATGNQLLVSKILLWGVDAGLLSALAVGIPYVLTFYLALSVLEDTGYLNSLAFIADSVMRRIGLHGRSIIPLLAGAGCNVPAIMGTRVLQTRRERIITSTLITMVPCSARIAILLGVVGVIIGWTYAAAIFSIDLALIIVVGFALNHFLPGRSSGLVMEVFPFRMPDLSSVARKTWIRFKGFMVVALPIVTLGSAGLGVLYETGIIWTVMKPTAPLIEGFLGLPLIAGICLLLGILRKELTIQLLMALAVMQYGSVATNLLAFMSPLQLFVFALVVTLYFPCIATASVMTRELGWLPTILAMALTVGLAFLVGGLTFQAASLIGAG